MKQSSDDEMVSPHAIGLGLLIFLAVYQIGLMAAWITWVEHDWLLLRISLSFSDALGIGALSLAFYTYWQMWKIKRKYGTYDFDTVEKRIKLEKAGDALDAMERVNETIERPPERSGIVDPIDAVHVFKGRLEANGGKEEAQSWARRR